LSSFFESVLFSASGVGAFRAESVSFRNRGTAFLADAALCPCVWGDGFLEPATSPAFKDDARAAFADDAAVIGEVGTFLHGF